MENGRIHLLITFVGILTVHFFRCASYDMQFELREYLFVIFTRTIAITIEAIEIINIYHEYAVTYHNFNSNGISHHFWTQDILHFLHNF